MVAEKVAAFSAAGEAMVAAWWKAQTDSIAQVSTAKSGSRIATSTFAVAEYWSDVGIAMLRNVERSARLGGDTASPIYRTVTANARRSKKRARAA